MALGPGRTGVPYSWAFARIVCCLYHKSYSIKLYFSFQLWSGTYCRADIVTKHVLPRWLNHRNNTSLRYQIMSMLYDIFLNLSSCFIHYPLTSNEAVTCSTPRSGSILQHIISHTFPLPLHMKAGLLDTTVRGETVIVYSSVGLIIRYTHWLLWYSPYWSILDVRNLVHRDVRNMVHRDVRNMVHRDVRNLVHWDVRKLVHRDVRNRSIGM